MCTFIVAMNMMVCDHDVIAWLVVAWQAQIAWHGSSAWETHMTIAQTNEAALNIMAIEIHMLNCAEGGFIFSPKGCFCHHGP